MRDDAVVVALGAGAPGRHEQVPPVALGVADGIRVAPRLAHRVHGRARGGHVGIVREGLVPPSVRGRDGRRRATGPGVQVGRGGHPQPLIAQPVPGRRDGGVEEPVGPVAGRDDRAGPGGEVVEGPRPGRAEGLAENVPGSKVLGDRVSDPGLVVAHVPLRHPGGLEVVQVVSCAVVEGPRVPDPSIVEAQHEAHHGRLPWIPGSGHTARIPRPSGRRKRLRVPVGTRRWCIWDLAVGSLSVSGDRGIRAGQLISALAISKGTLGRSDKARC